MPEVPRPPHQVGDRMVRGQLLERGAQITQILVGETDLEQAAILLHHVDPGPPVGCIHHQVHRAVRTKDIAKRTQTEVRVRQVMEHAGADDLVERAPKLVDALNRKLMKLEVLQTILSLEIARVAQARVADVYRGDSGIGLAKRVPGRLRCAAAGDEDFLVSAQRLGRPHQMEQRPATVRILVQIAVFIQAGERCRIRHPFVEVADVLRDGSSRPFPLVAPVHVSCPSGHRPPAPAHRRW